jgi:dipeptidyl aminopeptidase/acylaminoacyl peptidase
MKAVIRFLAVALTAGSSLAIAQPVQQASSARGRTITSADIKAWNSIRGATLSNDGKWFAYTIAPAEGNGTLHLESTTDATKDMVFPIGSGGGSFTLSGDSRWLGFIVAPPRLAAGARGRGTANGRGGAGAAGPGAAPSRNKLVLLNIATGDTTVFKDIRSFQFNGDSPTWIALQGYGEAAAPAAAAAAAGGRGGRGGGRGSSGGGSDLNLYRISDGEILNIGNVGEFAFDDDGAFLAWTTEAPDMLGNGVQVRNLKTDVSRSFDSERALYRHLVWADSGEALGVLRGEIDAAGRDTLFSIVELTDFDANGPTKKTVFDPSEHSDFPAGMKIASSRAPQFSADMKAVFFGIREAAKAPAGRGIVASANTPSIVQAGAPGAGGTINQTGGRGGRGAAADEIPSLVLWHWKDPRPQPQQIVQESADRAFTYLTEYRYDENKVVRLVTDDLRNVSMSSNDLFAYGTDAREYQQPAVTTGRNYSDVYSVDLKTGARKLLLEKQPGNGSLRLSPDGKLGLYWGTDGNWWTLDLVSGVKKNITRGVPTSFIDVDDDHNNLYPPSASALGWSSDGSSVLLSDLWDIWKVPVDGGKAVNLTADGRKTQVRYRSIYNFGQASGGGRGGRGGGRGGSSNGVDLTKPLYVSTYGEWTKKEGVSRIDPSKPGATKIFSEPARFSIQKAKDADTYVFTRQTFTEYPNYWLAGENFAPKRQLTDANPQMKDLAWSSGTRLIDYTSAKGDKLQGAMYLPANFDSTKKYPLLVTIYEKRSQNLNGFVSPSETRTPDPTLYTNAGYIVFDPDIVYKVNDPGMSAVWCVVPAVKAAIATGFVDAQNVGLWGHSWGGYQTAFLVTQTNIFAAAIAGAPLTNMVSMYGSIYWNSGGTDAAIFESSQGRFKGNFIDNYDAYIRNSPVFHADKVQTPLIILQNDKDGAVDFNQGVTYYNTLVNLKKDVIFLEYVGENHGLSRPVNQKDYAGRMREFFDYHLKGAPEADWIKSGIPRIDMKEHLEERKAASDSTGRRIIRP